VDVSPTTGSIHLNAGVRSRRTLPVWKRQGVDEWLDRAADAVVAMPETCALDVAERGGASLEEIAQLLGITWERARQIESTALAKLRQLAADGADGDQAE
jgi:hypothetical protein